MMRLSLDTEAASMVIILTIKWFATANLLNVSIYAEKWLALALTSYASSVADVANPRSQTMNVWINDPTFIVGDHFVLRIPAFQFSCSPGMPVVCSWLPEQQFPGNVLPIR